MKLNRLLFASVLCTAVLFSCSKEEDDEPEPVPPRDRSEQDIADQEALQEYLQTHFYNYEEFETPPEGFDYNVDIDTISGENAGKTPLIESPLLEEKVVQWEGVDYKMYILKVREGAKQQPKFTDSTLVTYRGELLDQEVFDNSVVPTWFDLTKTIPGFGRAMVDFGGASDFTVRSDNTVEWTNDFGIGAVFIPSGLAYFASPQPTIPMYSPLVFTFNLYGVNEADHDRDGVPSWMEDVDSDKIISNDDTDNDRRPNYVDPDDDGDFYATEEEIEIAEDGTLVLSDSDGDGLPDYLDPDSY